jgi:hypothetical protein
VQSLTDMLWMMVRWTVPLTVVGIIGAGVVGGVRINEELRRRVESAVAEHVPHLGVQVQGADLVSGMGIVIRGLAITDPRAPTARRQVLWIDEVWLACDTHLAELALAKPRLTAVRIRRPMVHAYRDEAGSWNLASLAMLLRPGGRTHSLPVSVEDATVLVEDGGLRIRETFRSGRLDVRPLTDSAEEGTVWAVRGGGTADSFQSVTVEGTVRPQGGDFDLRGSLEGLECGPRTAGLVKAGLPVSGRDWGQDLAAFTGTVDLSWQAAGRLTAWQQASWRLSGAVSRGRIEHPSLPLPIADVAASFTADPAGFSLDSATGRSGVTILRSVARLAGWDAAADFDCLLEAERLVVGRHWQPLLPERFATHWRKLLPAGEVDLRAHLIRTRGDIHPEVSVRCRNLSLTHYRFPYRLDRTVGTIVLEGSTLSLHLSGQAGSRPIQITGSLRDGGQTGFVEVRGTAIPIDESLVAALPPRGADVVRSLRGSGSVDFVFRQERAKDLPEGRSDRLDLRLSNGHVNYSRFPYPLSRVQGFIHMEQGVWTVREMTGRNDSGTVRCTGQLLPQPDGDGLLTLQLTGEGVVLEQELRDALPTGVQRLWDDMDPRGQAAFSAVVTHETKSRRTTVEIEASPHGDTVSIEPVWFPYRLEKLRGHLHWNDGLLSFDGWRGTHDRTTVLADGTCRFGTDGNWQVSFSRLAADRFRADHDVLRALPVGLEKAISAVRPHGLLSVDGTLDIYSTSSATDRGRGMAASWDMHLDMEQGGLDVGVPLEHVHGGVHLAGTTDGSAWQATGELLLDSASWRGVQLTSVRGPLAMDAAGVRFGAAADSGHDRRRLSAAVAGGTLWVDGSMSAAAAGQFTVAASLEGADLERLACDCRGTPHRYRGRVFGDLEVSGTRGGSHSLAGQGQLRLRDADIFELPLVVAMLKVLRVKPPDRNAFGSSMIDCRVEGPRAYLDTIELSGDAISLVGNGEIDFDGNVGMTFRSIMGDAESQLPAMKRVLGGASGQFLLIHVAGTIAEPEINTEAFPSLAAALQKLQAQRQENDRIAIRRRGAQWEGMR